ncbi:MAG: hypothetical protein AAB922_03035 [Patescibacteria group bacterium]
MNEKLFCPSCRKENEYTTKERFFSNGTKHIEAICVTCNKWIKFLQQVGAEEFRMPYGKHKGKTLRGIKEEDREYLEWFVENSESLKIIKRIKEVLESYEMSQMF